MAEGQDIGKIIINVLLKFSEFKTFYREKWEPRENGLSVSWNINETCNGFAYSKFDQDTREALIELRGFPETFNDAYLAAHEMVHVLSYYDGQDLKFTMKDLIVQRYGEENILDLATRIGSTFDDPVVDRFLQNTYNFNPAHHYTEVVIPDIIRSLNSSGDSKDDLTLLKNAFFYAQRSLQFDSVRDAGAKHKWHELKKIYKKRRPKTLKTGTDLYYMANKGGYDTLEKQRSLYKEIADKYTIDGIKLGDILGVL